MNNVLLVAKTYEINPTMFFTAIGLMLLFGLFLGLTNRRRDDYLPQNYYQGYPPQGSYGQRGSPGSLGFVTVVTFGLIIVVLGFALLNNDNLPSGSANDDHSKEHYKKQFHDNEDQTTIEQPEEPQERLNVSPEKDQGVKPKPGKEQPSDTQFVGYNYDTSYEYVYTVQYAANSVSTYAENTWEEITESFPGLKVWLHYNETDQLTRVCINLYRTKDQAKEIAAQLSRLFKKQCYVYEVILAKEEIAY